MVPKRRFISPRSSPERIERPRSPVSSNSDAIEGISASVEAQALRSSGFRIADPNGRLGPTGISDSLCWIGASESCNKTDKSLNVRLRAILAVRLRCTAPKRTNHLVITAQGAQLHLPQRFSVNLCLLPPCNDDVLLLAQDQKVLDARDAGPFFLLFYSVQRLGLILLHRTDVHGKRRLDRLLVGLKLPVNCLIGRSRFSVGLCDPLLMSLDTRSIEATELVVPNSCVLLEGFVLFEQRHRGAPRNYSTLERLERYLIGIKFLGARTPRRAPAIGQSILAHRFRPLSNCAREHTPEQSLIGVGGPFKSGNCLSSLGLELGLSPETMVAIHHSLVRAIGVDHLSGCFRYFALGRAWGRQKNEQVERCRQSHALSPPNASH